MARVPATGTAIAVPTLWGVLTSTAYTAPTWAPVEVLTYTTSGTATAASEMGLPASVMRPRTPPLDADTISIAFALNRLIRSEEHTSELQSPCNLVCRLLLE